MAAATQAHVPAVSSKSRMSVLARRLLAVHVALDRAGLPHAFGGAIALAYCTQEPRGTRDLDVNIFVGADRAEEAFGSLPRGVTVTAANRRAAARDGQVRVMWDDTPLDVFFDTHAFHQEAARSISWVPFEGTTIPVLACEFLIIFKAMFNRTKDWADIEAMIQAGSLDAHWSLERLRTLLGSADPVVIRLEALLP